MVIAQLSILCYSVFVSKTVIGDEARCNNQVNGIPESECPFNRSSNRRLFLPVTTNAICSLSASIFNERLTRKDGATGGATTTQWWLESNSGFMPGNSEAICPSSPRPIPSNLRAAAVDPVVDEWCRRRQKGFRAGFSGQRKRCLAGDAPLNTFSPAVRSIVHR